MKPKGMSKYYENPYKMKQVSLKNPYQNTNDEYNKYIIPQKNKKREKNFLQSVNIPMMIILILVIF